MSSLFGQQIDNSTKIETLIKNLVTEVEQINAQIKTVQGARPEFLEAGKNWIDKTGQFRGRPLHYPYVGTGSGRGPFVELQDGSIKLDLINGIGIHLMGHGNPRVMQAALRGALSDIVTQGNLQPNKEYTIFSEKIAKLAGKNSRLKYAWLSTCGTMANENALKISRQKNSPARMVISFKNAFAGRSTMMAEVTDNPAYKVGLPEYHEVLRVPFFDKNDPGSTEKALAAMKEIYAKHENNICAFGFEPMLGEGGYQAAPRDFFIPMLEFCKEKGIAVWADEVQTFTRTGELFAFETLGIGQYIDICTIAKTAQVGVTLYTEEYNPKPGLIAGTFSGSSVSLRAGSEILDMLQEGYLGPKGRIMQIHKKFISMLNALNLGSCKGKVQDAGGMGLMIAFTPFDGKKEQVDALSKKLFSNGLICFTCGKDPVRIRFLVPATIQDQEIDLAIEIVEKTILEGV
ncbi:MAG: aminotransferase class III-fold pyridoxal phosphate-dependent enzyme [Bdellovibrionaceae bacterium]|nr:aminotransferase class III-fold pyridoxal phosphate-dependent enzyme [Pseudobdellovibrionaceae bacterium]